MGGEQRTTAAEAASLLPLVYDELCCLSRARLARLAPGHAMSPTELVHEAYLRVANGRADRFADRRQLFFAIGRAMRDILVEDARARASLKRGGSFTVVSAAAVDELASAGSPESLLELDLALQKLERKSPQSAQVVLLGAFGGLTQQQIAAALGLSLATVERRWRHSRAWLRRELSASGTGAGGSPRARKGADEKV